MSKFLPGTVEKNSSTIKSSGRNRTCAIPVGASVINVYFRVVMLANGLKVNHYDFVPLHSMWEISNGLMCLSTFGVGSIPAGGTLFIVDEFFSTFPGKNFDMHVYNFHLY